MFNHPLRSLLFVPGHNRKLIKYAINSNADVLLLDIEDSVQPRSNKQRHNKQRNSSGYFL